MPDQGALFAEPARPWTRQQPKAPIGDRAGTKLDHRFTEPVYGKAKTGRLQHGWLDRRHRLYQGGGDLADFVYWKYRLVTLSLDVWEAVRDEVDWIELVDHTKNRCYRSDADYWRTQGQVYNAGIGNRIGIPMDLCTVTAPP